MGDTPNIPSGGSNGPKTKEINFKDGSQSNSSGSTSEKNTSKLREGVNSGTSRLKQISNSKPATTLKKGASTLKNGATKASNSMQNSLGSATSDITNGGGDGETSSHNEDTASELTSKASDAGKKTIQGIKNAPQKAKQTVDKAKKTAKKIKEAPQKAKKAVENTKKAAKTTAKAVKQTVKAVKAAIKATIKAIKVAIKVAQAVIKALAAAIKALVAFFCTPPGWITLIILLVVVIVCAIWNFLDNDSTSDNKTLTNESAQYNETEIDKDGNATVKSYSGTTKIIEAFYEYFSEKSLWVVYDGVVHNDETLEQDTELPLSYSPIQYNSEDFITKYQDDEGNILLKDKEDREKKFLINPNALFIFDKYLHNEQFRFPEQIVLHVAYDYKPSELTGSDVNETNDKKCLQDYDKPDNRFVLKQLTDDDRILNIESQKYKNVKSSSSEVSDTFRTENPTIKTIYVPDGDNKVNGVWDYGLGSILHYEKYLAKHEKRGNVQSFQVWDETKHMNSDGTISYGEIKKFESYEDYENDSNKDNYKGTDLFADLDEEGRKRVYTNKTDPDDPDLADEPYYFIDWVVTPAGDVVNNIIYEWIDSGIEFNRTETQKTSEDCTTYSEQIKDSDPKTDTITRTPPSNTSNSSCVETTTNAYYTRKVYPRPLRANVDDDLPNTHWDEGSAQNYTWTCSNPSKTYDCGGSPLNDGLTANECNCTLKDGETCTTDHGSHYTKHTHNDSCSYHYDHSNCQNSYTYTYTEEEVKVTKNSEKKNLNGYINGTKWDKEPRYEGSPDMTNFTGKRYYEDYMTHYDTWIPYNVSGFFNYDSLMKRINASNDEDLNKIIERSNAGSDGENSLLGGSGTASSDMQAWIEKIKDICIEEGQHVGIYPSIIIAQTILESGGGTSNLGKNHYNLVGMSMGTSHVGETVTFWDGSTYTKANYVSNRSWADFTQAGDFDAGIVMCIRYYGRNFWATSAYGNAGVLNHISAGLSAQEAQEDAKKQLSEIQPVYAPSSDGNAGYQENILKIIETYNLWSIDEEFLAAGGWDGTNPYPDLGGSGGSSSSSGVKSVINSIWSWLKGVMDTIQEKFADLFDKDPYYSILDEKERFSWEQHNVQESDVNYVLQSIFAYTSNKTISTYHGKIDDEFFEDYYTELFSNPLGTGWDSQANNGNETSSNNISQQLKDMYFPDGFTNPLSKIQIDTSRTSDYGIYLKAADGENVFATTSGTIKEVGDDEKYGGKYVIIDNGNSFTILGNLKTVNVEKGDSVNAGDIIGTAKGDYIFFGLKNSSGVVVDPTFLIGIASGNEVVDYAAQFIGNHYKWGGNNPNVNNWRNDSGHLSHLTEATNKSCPLDGIDCSGFVAYVYGHFGKNLPHSSSDLRNVGTAVSLSDIQPGDIVCYSGHVVIYAGNGKTVEASCHKNGIVSNNFKQSGIVAIRRIS